MNSATVHQTFYKAFGGRATSGVLVLINKLNVYHIEIL